MVDISNDITGPFGQLKTSWIKCESGLRFIFMSHSDCRGSSKKPGIQKLLHAIKPALKLKNPVSLIAE